MVNGFDIIAVTMLAVGQCGPNGCPPASAPVVARPTATPDYYWRAIPNEPGQVALYYGGTQKGVYVFSTGTYHALESGKWVASETIPIAPPVAPVAAVAAPASDDQLFERLQQRFGADIEKRTQSAIERHVTAIAQQIDEYDPANPKKTFALGAILAVAIGGLVTKVVQMIITAILLALFWKLLGKYVLWIVGAAVAGLLGVVVVSRSAGASAARKAVGK